MRVVLTGGGTGGHLVPFEPIVDALRTVFAEQQSKLPKWINTSKFDIYFLGVLDDKTKEFFTRLNVETINIPAGKLRRYPSPRTAADILLRMPVGIVMALIHMWRIMPDVVISKGGYGSVPVSLAAVFYRVPVLLHESDVVFGLANRLMTSIASAITVGFPAAREQMVSYKDKTVVTGTPVRGGLALIEQAAAKKMFGFKPTDPVLLVMGGSQGSEQINDVVLSGLPSLIKDMSIIHLTGEDHLKIVAAAAKDVLKNGERGDYYKPFGYLTERMGEALSAADVVVTRAGATSLAELARLRKAAILIPLDLAAQDHQRRNATVFEMAGAARVIDPANLGRALFEQNVRDLMQNHDIAETLRANMAQLDYTGASRDIVQLAFKLAVGLVPRQTKGVTSN